MAQAQTGTVLEEIVVTAAKRGEQRLQDIPAQVQAFTGQDLEDFLALEFSDLAMQIPSLQFQDLGPGDKEYIIRGVNSTATATVGVYFDEAVITARTKQDGGGRQADIEMHDLERVEVLKGPQGTLYGASSMSGTIRFIPNRPDPTQYDGSFGSRVGFTENGDETWHLNGMVNVPIIEDRLAIRGVGWVTRQGGFVDNIFLGLKDINDNDVEGWRVSAAWDLSDEITVSAFGLMQDRKVGGTSRQMPVLQDIFVDNFTALEGVLAAQGFPSLQPPQDRTVQSFTRDEWDEETRLWGAKIEYDTSWGNILYTANWFEHDVLFNFDSTPILLNFGVPAAAITSQPQSREVFNTEIRYASKLGGPIEFVIGGFLSREDKVFDTQVIASGTDGRPLGPFMPGDPNAIFGREKFDELDEEALFFDIEWRINEKWALSFGGRYYQFDIVSDNNETQSFGPVPTGAIEPIFTVDADKFTTKTTLTHWFTEDHLLYFTASQGFRPGGTNDVAFVPPDTPEPPAGFGPDELWNYEFGWKTSWYDDRLQINGAVFFIRWDDIQVKTFDPASPFNVVRNQGEASIDGVEVEVIARPLDGLDVFFGGSFQDARFTATIPGESPARPFAENGDDIPNVPDLQLNATAQYTYPLFANVNGILRVEYSFRDNTLISPRDPVLNVKMGAFSLTNVRVGVETDKWSAGVFVNNITDKQGVFDVINSAQDPRGIITARPRTVGLNFRYNF